ncbi:hypothetical protein BDW75DRAFT_208810 [Aspergillus navahoensis]
MCPGKRRRRYRSWQKLISRGCYLHRYSYVWETRFLMLHLSSVMECSYRSLTPSRSRNYRRRRRITCVSLRYSESDTRNIIAVGLALGRKGLQFEAAPTLDVVLARRGPNVAGIVGCSVLQDIILITAALVEGDYGGVDGPGHVHQVSDDEAVF